MMYFALILLSFGINVVCEKNAAARSQFRNQNVDFYEYVYVTNNSSVLYWVDHDVEEDENLRIKYNKRLSYHQAQFLNEENFEISFTTRIRENMFPAIFLCNKENVFPSSCYWLSVSNFKNGRKTEIRECQQDFNFVNYYRKIRSLCKLLRQEFCDTRYFNEENATNEFKLYKNENYIRLVQGNGIKEILLMEYHERKIFIVKNALIYSEDDKIGIWKVNKIEYKIAKQFQKQNEYFNNLHGFLNHWIRSSTTFGRKLRKVPDDGDFPKIQDIKTRSICVIFTEYQASLLKQSRVSLACVSTWCKKPVIKLQCSINSTVQCEIDGLQPFTKYKITFKFCSGNQNCSDDMDIITRQFKTKAATPHSIRNLEVYSKNEYSISLRWEPPYPPTGILSHYKISYSLIEEKTKVFDIQRCRLWPNFHCYTLIGLENNSRYTINLKAANQDPNKYGQTSDDIIAVTKTEPSEAPYDLDVEWNVENNLILKWKHPNITNGKIQYFDIILNPVGHESKTIKKVLNISKPRLQYSYNIDAKEFLPSADYNISISAYNGFNGKNITGNCTSPVYNFFNQVSAWTGNFKGTNYISERSSGTKEINKHIKVVESTSSTKKGGYHINEHLQKKNEQKTIDTLHNGLNTSLNRSLSETFSRKKRGIIFKNEDIEIRSATMTILDVQEYASVQLNITCLNVWCEQPSQIVTKTLERVHGLSNKSVLFIHDLQPFTDYKIIFKFCRENENCSEDVIAKQIRTKPGAPNSIKQLQVYSKDDNSISLRWKPPYPPTGKLARYRISYTLIQEQNTDKTKGFQVESCCLWPEHHCYTLSGLKSENEYSITLAAKNEDPEEYGQISDSISVITKKASTTYWSAFKNIYVLEPSDAPYDLDIEWTIENNLILKWKHPNITNGEIQYFDIILNPVGHESKPIKKVLNISKPVLQYTYNIDAKELLPSTEYNLSISAYNDFNGKNLTANCTSPPSTPSFDFEPKVKVLDKVIKLSTSIGDVHSEKLVDSLSNYELFIFISDGHKKGQLISKTPDILKSFRFALSEFVFLYDCKLKGPTKLNFNIGKNDDISSCDKISNYFIDPDEESYNITIILTYTYRNRTSYKIYSWSVGNNSVGQSSTLLITLLIIVFLLLLILLGLFIYVKKNGFKCYVPHIISQHLMSKNVESEEISLMQYTCQKTSQYSNRITLSDFEQYVKQSIMNGALERQYDLIIGETGRKPCDYGILEENKSKNRYTNSIAYDHSRVVLQKIENKEYSDYINANYIDGYQTAKVYIATQAPTKSTVFDFWRMIWQESVRNIFMLAKLNEGEKHKVIQYWPDVNGSMSFDNINVEFVSSKTHADYEQTIFRVTCNGQLRIVEHFHFTSWPDHGVPLYPQTLVPLLEELHHIPLSSNSPIVVHCNAGVGRTGTILLCDICLRMADKEGAIDVVGNLQKLREQRSNMVSNVQQYKLVHLVILEYVFGKKTGIACASIETKVEDLIKDGRVKLQMEYLEEMAWKDDAMKSVVPANQDFVGIEEKSRFPGLVPENLGIVVLAPYPLDDPTSSFINAVTVDGFKIPNKFIVTQQPLPNTVGDFWRLVHQRRVLLVLSLNNIDEEDPSSCTFWPTSDKPLLEPVDYLILKHLETSRSESYDNVTIQLSDKEEERLIEILSIKSWSPGAWLPNNKKEFLTFLEQARVTSKKSEQIVVTCYDGATASGLYVAMDFVIEMMNFTQVCDVCQAVRTVRRNRKQFIRNEDQLAFLYQIAVDFRKMSQLYANFN